MNRVWVFLATLALGVPSWSLAQDLAATASEQTQVSKILKTSGSLLLRESHKLSEIATSKGADISCGVIILKDLLAADASAASTTVGLSFSIKEKYSERTAYLDMDEAAGLLASYEKISHDGLAILENPIVPDGPAASKSAEIHYTTKEGVKLAAFTYAGTLTFGLKVNSVADWALLTSEGAATLARDLRQAREIAERAGS